MRIIFNYFQKKIIILQLHYYMERVEKKISKILKRKLNKGSVENMPENGKWKKKLES